MTVDDTDVTEMADRRRAPSPGSTNLKIGGVDFGTPYFLRVPQGLSGVCGGLFAALLLSRLLQRRQEGREDAGYENVFITSDTGLGEKALRTAKRKLVERDFIEIDSISGGANRYRVRPLVIQNALAAACTSQGVVTAQPSPSPQAAPDLKATPDLEATPAPEATGPSLTASQAVRHLLPTDTTYGEEGRGTPDAARGRKPRPPRPSRRSGRESHAGEGTPTNETTDERAEDPFTSTPTDIPEVCARPRAIVHNEDPPNENRSPSFRRGPEFINSDISPDDEVPPWVVEGHVATSDVTGTVTTPPTGDVRPPKQKALSPRTWTPSGRSS